MAALTWWLTGSTNVLTESDQGTEQFRAPTTGWIVSTGGTNHAAYDDDTEVAASAFTSTTPPDGSLSTAAGSLDFWRSPTALTGNFASANWSVHMAVRANSNGGAQDGRMRCRLFKGANADGTSATEITSAQQQGGLVTDLATGVTQTSTATFNPGAISLSNEYIFVQLAWERTGAGGMSSSDVNLRQGTSGCRVITSDFTAGAIDLTVADATQAQTPDNVVLGVHLVLADAAQAQTTDNVTLVPDLAAANAVQAQTIDNLVLVLDLVVADAAQAQNAENVILTLPGTDLVVADAAQEQLADGVVLVPDLIVENATQAQAADNLVLEVTLSIDAATQAQQADNVELAAGAVNLELQDAAQAQTSDNIVLVPDLVVADAVQGQIAEEVTLTVDLIVQDAIQQHLADNVELIPEVSLVLQDAAQTQVVTNLNLTLPGAVKPWSVHLDKGRVYWTARGTTVRL